MLDKLRAERERGITIDITLWKFDTPKLLCTLIDAPGHRDFIKNTITGTAQADVALLIVSGAAQEFENGMSPNGQTKEHALLAYTLGIRQMIVLVNKMDHPSVNFAEARFVEVKEKLQAYLAKTGFNPETIPFIPISGWHGENLTDTSANMSWWKGGHLMEAIDKLEVPKRLTEKPLRFPLQDVYKIGGVGTVCVGRIETGVVTPGTELVIAPANVTTKVSSIEIHRDIVQKASAGDNVGLCATALSVNSVRRGDVCGAADNDPPAAVTDFIGQLVIVNHPGEIKAGYTPVVDIHTTHIACRFSELLSKINKKTGAEIESAPASLKKGDAALVKLEPARPLSCEPFNVYPPLGRFAMRDMRQTIAIGVVKSTTKVEPKK